MAAHPGQDVTPGLALQEALGRPMDAPVAGPGEDVRVVAAPVLAHPALEVGGQAFGEPHPISSRGNESVDGLVKVGSRMRAHPLEGKQHGGSPGARDRHAAADHEANPARPPRPRGQARTDQGFDVRNPAIEEGRERFRFGRAQVGGVVFEQGPLRLAAHAVVARLGREGHGGRRPRHQEGRLHAGPARAPRHLADPALLGSIGPRDQEPDEHASEDDENDDVREAQATRRLGVHGQGAEGVDGAHGQRP